MGFEYPAFLVSEKEKTVKVFSVTEMGKTLEIHVCTACFCMVPVLYQPGLSTPKAFVEAHYRVMHGE